MKMRALLTGFVWVFFGSGLLSLIYAIIEASTGYQAGAVMEPILIVWLLGFLLMLSVYYVGCALTPRLPKWVILSGVAFFLAEVVAGVVILECAERTQTILSIATSLFQCILGAFYIYQLRDPQTGFFSLLRNPSEHKPLFSLKNLLVFSGTNIVILSVLFVVGVYASIVGLENLIEEKTAGYVVANRRGIFLQERHFERDGKQVHLVGMMHIGNKSFYDEVLAGIPDKGRTAVLLEGVSDKSKLLQDSHLDYGRIARALGLKDQGASSFTKAAVEGLSAAQEKPTEKRKVQYIRADCDLSDLRPQSVTVLRAIMRVMASKNIPEAMRNVNALSSYGDEEPAATMTDIVDTRNKFVFAKIEEALNTYENIVVPWGAAHMAYLEEQLLAKGFREIHRIERTGIKFRR